MKNVMSLFSGIIFAIGLVVSGMTDPKKVIGFLDIFGQWDYSLAFVMGGAVAVNLILFKWILSRKPLFNDKHDLPIKSNVDARLLTGSVMFGVGWGLVGICPGPSVVNLVTGNSSAIIFFIAMAAGFYLEKKLS
jgi:hypothetical protein